MRIKRLELSGFKSFLNKTVINFDSTITGVVGPNGCGKSNIVDALIWVMGEQSPKSLRGSSMEDVIFKGSDNKNPSGICEVSITLENDGLFPVKYISFSEITITRRLYRNGESEYLINKVQTRLKDIKEIFMDSGARTYAVIEQGEIERIVLSKPQDRRELIEETAGITKYRIRKEESSKKLEATEQNLLRLNDILSELIIQIDNLEKQAKKALKYKSIKNDIVDLETKVAVIEYTKINNLINDTKLNLEYKNNEKIDIENKLSNLELEIEKNKSQKLSIEEKITELQVKSIDLNTTIHKSRAKIDILNSEMTNIDSKKEGHLLEINSLEIRIKRQEEELRNLDKQIQEHQYNTDELKQELEETQSYLDKLINDKKDLEYIVEDLKIKEINLVQNNIINTNIFNTNNSRIETNQIRVDKYNDELNKFNNDLNNNKDLSEILNKNINTIKNQKIDLNKIHGEKTIFYNNLKNSLKTKELDRANVKSNYDKVNSRLTALIELEDKKEGLSEGTKIVLNTNKENQFVIIADLIKVQKKYEKVLEAVIGANAEIIITNNKTNIIEIIKTLKINDNGRASFISKDINESLLYRNNGILNNIGVIGLFVDLFSFNEEYSSIINMFFKDIYLVENIEIAKNLKDQFEEAQFVTLEGDIIDKRGVYTGGSYKSINTNLFQRKREIQDLKSEKEILQETLKIFDEEIIKLNSDIEAMQFELEKNKDTLSTYAIEEATLSKELENTNEEYNKINHRISELTFEIDQLRFENSHLEKEINIAIKNKENNLNQLKVLNDELELNKVKLNEFELHIAPTRDKFTNVSVSYSTINERYKSVEERKAFLQETINEDKLRLENLVNESLNSNNRLADLVSEKEELNILIDNKSSELILLNEEINNIKNLNTTSNSIIDNDEISIKECRTNINSILNSITSLNIFIGEQTGALNTIKNRLYENFNIDIESKDLINELDLNEETLLANKDKLSALNIKLMDFGHVNLLAIEEFEKVNKRHDFLNTQKQDLEKSILDLKNVIKKIDETSKDRFKTAFELVNDKFQKFFPILFGGGKAKMVLTEPSDMLNTGVDIVAELPGKKTQNINLFSGGEKALTAISLVFSIFAVKPSPFCVLDEVDAPLDDANITRFNEAVRALIDKTQFVLITHNKRTMEMVDVLYGITMEEPGVSRMVSIRIGKYKNKEISNLGTYVADSTYLSKEQLSF